MGALIAAIFGGVWALAGSAGLAGRSRGTIMALCAAIAAMLIVFVLTRPPTAAAGFFKPTIYGWSVAGEVIAIVLAVVLLRIRRRADFILPSVGLIVGLHFIGMWKAIGLVLFLAVAVAMSAVSLVAFFLPGRNAKGFSARQAVAGFGCAIVLWLAALALG